MKELIRKFTCGHPKHMRRPVFWLYIENFFVAVPTLGVYLTISIIAEAYDTPLNINIDKLWMISLVLAAVMVMQFGLTLGSYLNTFIPAAIHSADNKLDFVKKLRKLPLGFYSKKESGELINTFTGDFLALEQSMVAVFTGIFSIIIACVMTFIFMFIYNPIMAAALYICIPISVLVLTLSLKTTTSLAKKNRKAKDKTATYLNEYLLGMRILRSYNQTGDGFGKLKDAYRHLMKVNMNAETIGGSFVSIANTFVKVGLPLMCFTGAYLLLGGRLSIVDYLGLIVIGTKILSPVITWISYMVMLRGDYVSATRIDDIMQYPEMGGEGDSDGKEDISFQNVNFSYNNDGNRVIKNMSFKIPSNKLTAIVGPSGSGKSTIVKLMARFWDVESGQICCGNKPLDEINADNWISNISMVLQDVYLFNETIRDNILFGRKDASEDEMIEAAKRAQCHDFIMELPKGYDTVVGEGGNTLSGGEKQRISIARAILKDAPILLLDEPTSSLDARNEVFIQKAVNELVKGRTVVMIAHKMKVIKNADQILVIDKGEVTESGTHNELMDTRGLYYRLWTIQE